MRQPHVGDKVRRAIALFRAENAARPARVLADVPESAGPCSIRALGKDERARFEIADCFAGTPNNANQQDVYNALAMGVLVVLATIELTDRLLARQAPA